jgi:phospholipase C
MVRRGVASGGLFIPGTTIATPDLYNVAGLDPYEYGYRVPLLVITPYLGMGPGTVDHTVRSTASILDFIEYTFGVPEGTLGTLDNAGMDDLRALASPGATATQPPPTPIASGFPASNLPQCNKDEDTTLEPND